MAWSAARIRLLGCLVIAACVALAVAAALAESERAPAGPQPWLVPLVGLLLAAASVAMRGPLVPRVLLSLTALTWLLGSLDSWLLLVHQGVLLLVLLTVVTGRLRDWEWVAAFLAVPIALGMMAQPAVGFTYMVVGAAAVVRRRKPAAIGAAVAAALVGGTLLGAWLVSRVGSSAFDPYAAVLVYEGALVASAGALVLGSRAEVARRRDLVDRLVAGAGSAGLVGLGEVLANVLRAPGLRILRAPVARDVGDDLRVELGDRTAAVVRHPVLGTLDAAVRVEVAAAVRLVVLGEERRSALEAQVVALEAAQRRMVAAQDEQRAATAAKLRGAVVAPLGEAATVLDSDERFDRPSASADALEVARAQIRAATADVEELVHGAGPGGLGHGRLVDAVRAMARRSPVPVEVRVEGTVASPPEVETTLYYVCAEALVNVHRHAQANAATVVLARDGDRVRLTVISDDGVGGADLGGSGLSGLADRVRAARRPAPGGQSTRSRHHARRRAPGLVGGYSPTRCHGTSVRWWALGVGEGELVAVLAPRRAVRREHEAGVRIVHRGWAAHNPVSSDRISGSADEPHRCVVALDASRLEHVVGDRRDRSRCRAGRVAGRSAA